MDMDVDMESGDDVVLETSTEGAEATCEASAKNECAPCGSSKCSLLGMVRQGFSSEKTGGHMRTLLCEREKPFLVVHSALDRLRVG